MSTAELFELLLILRSDLSAQFQYWLSITFALLVARYIAGDRFQMRWRILAAVLYGLSTAAFLTLYFVTAQNLRSFLDELSARGDLWTDQATMMIAIRITLFVVGTVGTLWFLFATDSAREKPRINEVD